MRQAHVDHPCGKAVDKVGVAWSRYKADGSAEGVWTPRARSNVSLRGRGGGAVGRDVRMDVRHERAEGRGGGDVGTDVASR